MSTKRNPWTQRVIEKLIRHYIDETGHQDYDKLEMAEWAKKRGYTMPVPQTDTELLASMIGAAATRAKRRDKQTRWSYRSLLAYPAKVMGEWKVRWFDADGPTATEDKIIASCHRRKEQALNILVGAKSTYEHHAKTHPKQKLGPMSFGVSEEEVDWRLAGRSLAEGNDDQQEKAI